MSQASSVVAVFKSLIRAKDVAKLREFVQSGNDPNSRGLRGATPLHAAAQAGCLACVEALIGVGALPNAQDEAGKSPLHVAGENLQQEIYRFLVSKGASECLADSQGNIPPEMLMTAQAWRACIDGDAPGVAELIQNDERIASRELSTSMKIGAFSSLRGSILHVAILSWRSEILPVLTARGVDVEAPTRKMDGSPDHTPLGLACCYGDENSVSALLAAGAVCDPVLDFPLLYACEENRPSIVSVLLEAGANPTRPNSMGLLPIVGPLVHARKCTAVLKLLMKHGADPNVVHPVLKATPLALAVKYQLHAEADLLRAHGAREVL